MSVVTPTALKAYFETGDFPTQAQFVDLIDTLGVCRTVAYTVGVAAVTGVDYNFTSVANTTKQSIQLGAAAIIPASSLPLQIIAKCVTGINGGVTGTSDIGNSSGGNQFLSLANIDGTDEITNFNLTSGLATFTAAASSVYFSFTPSANWSTITTGKWKIWITYIDNSLL